MVEAVTVLLQVRRGLVCRPAKYAALTRAKACDGAVMFDTPGEAILARLSAARAHIIAAGKPVSAGNLVFTTW